MGERRLRHYIWLHLLPLVPYQPKPRGDLKLQLAELAEVIAVGGTGGGEGGGPRGGVPVEERVGYVRRGYEARTGLPPSTQLCKFGQSFSGKARVRRRAPKTTLVLIASADLENKV